MSHAQFRAFLEDHLSRIEPLFRAVRLAYWDATISGKKADFDRYAELNVEFLKIYSDAGAFKKLKTWREEDSITDPVDRRQLDLLYRAFLSNQLPSRLIERITRLSSEITNKFNVYRATVDGETLTGNQVRRVLRESTDSARLERVWKADKGVGLVVRDDLLELVRLRNEAATTLGFDNFYTMSLSLDEQDETDIVDLFDGLEEQTSRSFREMKAKVDGVLCERYGLSTDELRPWHYQDPYFQEAPHVHDLHLDTYYENEDILTLVSGFFKGIGLEVGDILERSDLYEKPGKEQHAYCMDIDRKGDIRILANIRSDEAWTGTMLHELGHAVYDRHIDPSLPFVLRQHAHVFTTEAIAMLFGRLSKDADWIQRTIGIPDRERASIAPAVRKHQKLAQLVFTRWCQVMVRFERALYRDPGQDLNTLWWELVERNQMVTAPDGRNEPDWAAKIHIVTAPVYYHNYMLGELLASQLDHFIQRHVLGSGDERLPMSDRSEVGEYLKESVFRFGRRFHWDRMIREATGEPLDPRYFVEQYVV
jgi:peptidyl-dipeptidase A